MESAEGSEATESAETAELEQLKAELEACDIKWKRAEAELINMQRRHERDRETSARYRVEPLARELLELVDAMDEAWQVMERDPALPDAVREGQALMLRRLTAALEKCHIQVVDPSGQKFDPNEHEALLKQPSEAHETGMIIEVLRRGYRLHDRLLRPARVIVAQKSTAGDEAKASKNKDTLSAGTKESPKDENPETP